MEDNENKPGLGEAREPKVRSIWELLLGALLFASVIAWGMNYLLVSHPVADRLSSDPRNASYELSAHYRYYVDPTTLVLNLGDVGDVSPADLIRGLFQAAATLHEQDRKFAKVILSRSGRAVYVMDGTDFDELGAEFALGQNPIYLIRTLPEKLRAPDGEAAFQHWEGGLLGVVGQQIGDATTMARNWAAGSDQ